MSVNGNGNGYSRESLIAQLSYFVTTARALADTIDLMDAAVKGEKKHAARISHTIERAVVADTERRARAVGTKKRPRKANSATTVLDKAAMKARRKRTAKMLKKLSRTQPFQLANNHGTLVNHGYLVKKGDGFVRSEKPFVP